MNPPRIAPRPPGPREAKLLMEAADALRRGDRAGGEHRLREYCARAPSDPVGFFNLAKLLRRKLAESEALLRRAIALEPRFHEAWLNLANVLWDRFDFAGAEAAARRTIELAPGSALASLNLALMLQKTGRIAEALTEIDRCLSLSPDFLEARRDRLMMLLYAEGITPQAIAQAHRDCGLRLEQAAGVRSRPARPPLAGRRLRVGYVSADFRRHAVMTFLSATIAAHDRSAVEIFCYSAGELEDDVTAELRRRIDGWISIVGLDDEAAARRIAADGIDVLVDLSGHSKGNRLGVFARRPAPAQGAWIGYPATTGMERIDFRITDSIADPPGVTDALHTETLARIDPIFLCFTPPAEAGAVSPPPSHRLGHVTFGSFNNVMKLAPAVIETWGRILGAIPEATLLLKSSAETDEPGRRRVVARFESLGVAADRVRFLERTRRPADHFRLYDEVDIALDPFPYNGTTTTSEALWMGVPVIALMGEAGHHAARVSASILSAINLPDLIAATRDDYVALAVTLARDAARLGSLRQGMRARMTGSPFMDAAGLTRQVERIYREAFERAAP